jgi:hypothetical protein
LATAGRNSRRNSGITHFKVNNCKVSRAIRRTGLFSAPDSEAAQAARGREERMRDLSAQYPRYGYRRIRIFFGRDGKELGITVSSAFRPVTRHDHIGDVVPRKGRT